MNIRSFLIIFLLIILFQPVQSQKPRHYSSGDIYQGIRKLNVLGSALYIAAHPDDENTRLITYLSNARHINTGYLSLTRGDGGQNSIGPEQAELLGIVRTQELLSARRIDGGTQFFTRAMDFGYSKSAEETLTIWSRENLLSDMIWVIRIFKPDVLITRFPADERAGHGQHEASADLAEEAFEKAGDPEVFPDQLKYVDPWQPERLLMNTGRWWNPDIQEGDHVISVDIGEYDPISGLSYSELGADSRSQHRSQAFGVTWTRGTSKEYFEHIKGTEPEEGIFDRIDLSWSRVDRPDIGNLIKAINMDYDFNDPAASLAGLLRVREKIKTVKNEFWQKKKLREVEELIKACLGLYLEATTDKSYASPGDSVKFHFEFTNRSDGDVILKKIVAEKVEVDSMMHISLENNEPVEFNISRKLTDDVPETSPYWLKNARNGYEYAINDELKRGKANNDVPVIFKAELNIAGEDITYDIPVAYTWTDRMRGQQYEPFEVGPALFTEINNGVYIFPDADGKTMQVKLTSRNQAVEGKLHLELPSGWQHTPQEITFNIPAESSITVTFTVLPPSGESQGLVRAVAVSGKRSFDRRMVSVEYEHFPRQVVFLPAEATVVKLDIQKKGEKIGYIMGAGDEVGESLSQIGYDITYINENNISLLDLDQFDAIVFGIMAFNNVEFISGYHDQFLNYLKKGGNLIIQYNNMRIGLKSDLIMPFPIEFSGNSARVRVSEEDAEVNFLLPDHPALNAPNDITENDFEGWIQERGLYFPVKWDGQYDALMSSHDTGEDPLKGGILVAEYGEGHYVYTSLSWFRQLPAGVPGAFRVFANLISLGR
ncbi:MAG: PIG-L family deacetylase [Cyclobacteriaceae bacterium]|nr:PIG-L family deacetylase [Cyclobacteriaceae bacterium]